MPLCEPVTAVFDNNTSSDEIAGAHSADVDMSGVSAEKVTVGVHTSVDTFFVAGKVYVVSPSNDTSVQEHTTDGDTPAAPYTRGSADITIETDVQDLTTDSM
jgi:hypothetical protein